MKLIAGLGNPGREYFHTRHNAGFRALDVIAEKMGVDITEKKHKGLLAKGIYAGQKVLLLKPLTYMNLSGESLRAAMDYYRMEKEDIVLLYDDISLPPGQLRIRTKGSAGGHNGIKSVISHLGSNEFLRIKIGIGEKPPRMDLADYVLSVFPSREEKVMEEAYENAASALSCLLSEGVDAAMNQFNKKNGQ